MEDMEDIMREDNIPMFSLESKTQLKEFDIVGFSLSYEMCYPNVLNALDLAGIPVRREEREEDVSVDYGRRNLYNEPCSY